MGFPHSEISGSKLARQLPEAYRSHTASFIAFFSLGIHRTPLLRTPVGNPENRVFSFMRHACLAHDDFFPLSRKYIFPALTGQDHHPINVIC